MYSPIRFRRLVSGLAAFAAATVVMAGCSSGSGDSGAGTLTLMIWDPAQKDGVQMAVDGFEEANPDIKVDLQQVPQDQYYTKLDASLSTGGGPDVMWQSSLAVQYVEGGALEPLDSYIEESGMDIADYSPLISDLYQFDDKQYGIAKDQDTWTFVYNTQVFDELGVTGVPTNDWTWDDMVRIAKKIQAKQTAASDVPLYYNPTFNNGTANVIHQLGGAVVDGGSSAVSSPEGVQGLEMIKDLQDDGLIPGVADSTDFDPVTALISGTVAMAQIPSWNLSLLSEADVPEGTFHLVRLPSVDGSWLTDTNGLSYTMNANSANKEAAWKLIEYLTSTEGAQLHAEGGASIPANTDPSTLDAYVQANSNLAGLEEAIALAHEQMYLRTSTEYASTRGALPEIESTQMGPFYNGSISADDAAAGIDKIVDKALG